MKGLKYIQFLEQQNKAMREVLKEFCIGAELSIDYEQYFKEPYIKAKQILKDG